MFYSNQFLTINYCDSKSLAVVNSRPLTNKKYIKKEFTRQNKTIEIKKKVFFATCKI